MAPGRELDLTKWDFQVVAGRCHRCEKPFQAGETHLMIWPAVLTTVKEGHTNQYHPRPNVMFCDESCLMDWLTVRRYGI